MQDFQSAPAGVAGRIFFAGTSSGDVEDFLRLRGYPMVGGGAPAAVKQLPVKCPRCDSANTKFCYYNNYNLSQPRHFCKNCRRYWTKGGVLRNVPVGGGCRKTKRSSSSKSSSKPSASGDKDGQQRRTSSSASRLSSKSSSNTAATAGDASALTPPMSGDPPILDQLVNTVVDAPSCSASETLQEALSARSLANVMVASAAPSASPVPFLGFSFNDPSPVRLPTGQHKTIDLEIGEQEKGQQQPQGFIVDHVISGDLRTVAGVGGGTGGLRALDWPSTVDPALFASAVDPGAYWNPNHLEYTDDSIYLS